jgi:hypothetical protein
MYSLHIGGIQYKVCTFFTLEAYSIQYVLSPHWRHTVYSIQYVLSPHWRHTVYSMHSLHTGGIQYRVCTLSTLEVYSIQYWYDLTLRFHFYMYEIVHTIRMVGQTFCCHRNWQNVENSLNWLLKWGAVRTTNIYIYLQIIMPALCRSFSTWMFTLSIMFPLH